MANRSRTTSLTETIMQTNRLIASDTYPKLRQDRTVVSDALTWLDTEATSLGEVVESLEKSLAPVLAGKSNPAAPSPMAATQLPDGSADLALQLREKCDRLAMLRRMLQEIADRVSI